MRSKEELDAAFKASKSVGKMMEIFQLISLSSGVKQSDLDFYCVSIINQLLKLQPELPGNAQQAYSFCMTALSIDARKIPCFEFPSNDINTTTTTVTHNHGTHLFIAAVKYVLGASCYGLMKFDESLRLLDWANHNLTELDNDEKNLCSRNCVRNFLDATRQLLFQVKAAMGNRDEAVLHTGKGLDAVFKASESVFKMMETFDLILASASFNQTDLVDYCASIIKKLLQLPPGTYPQVYPFCKTAFTIIYPRKFPCLLSGDVSYNEGYGLYIAVIQYLVGASCYSLMRWDESLRFLDWADHNLTRLNRGAMTFCPGNCARNFLAYTHRILCRVKTDMGRLDEAVFHAGRSLEVKLSFMQRTGEHADAHVEAYEACISAKDAKAALPFCLKSVDLYNYRERNCKIDPEDVALVRVDLEVLYRVVGKNEEAAEQNRLWQSVLKNKEHLPTAELKFFNRLLYFERFAEVFLVSSRIDFHSETNSKERLKSFVNRAWASSMLFYSDDARNYIREAKKLIRLNGDGSTYLQMSEVYENIGDMENAFLASKKAFEMSENLDLLGKSATRIFSLMPLAGRENLDIPYMRHVVEKLEKSFGQGHVEVGHGFAKFGAVLINSGQVDQAVKLIEDANGIMDVSLGPHHLGSLKTRHTLSEIYAKLGRYEEAIEIEEKVIEGTKGLEPSEQQFIDKAVKLLNKVKLLNRRRNSYKPPTSVRR